MRPRRSRAGKFIPPKRKGVKLGPKSRIFEASGAEIADDDAEFVGPVIFPIQIKFDLELI